MSDREVKQMLDCLHGIHKELAGIHACLVERPDRPEKPANKPVDPDAPKPDNSLPSAKPKPDNSLPGSKPEPTPLPA